MTDPVESRVYIDTDAGLADACRVWAEAPFLAIDTEFIRTDTFYPIAGLLQVGANGELYLIDPLPISDWSLFTELLRRNDLPKVIHSCSEDLEVFQVLFQCIPQPLLDTQVGAALAGMGASLSYQRLVMECLGVHVEKGETRSDWLLRPLSDSQCVYAALDVLYLQRIYPMLCQRLEEKGALEWWYEDCALLTHQSENPAPTSEYYLKVKSLWKLSRRQQYALQMLCDWRETEARARNIPRGRVLKDAACFEISRQQPNDAGQLNRIKDVSSGSVRRYGDTVLEILSNANESDEACFPPPATRPLTPAQTQLYKKMKSVAEQVANDHDIAAEVFIKKRDIESIIRSGTMSGVSTSWRKLLIGNKLLALVEGGS
ncbi:Ribonuclease D [Zhongshania aliphaticivorans]|uniref:Ribonuclease D n=1 Tax=Zhongshania aliphaticivorans TaxID=1470434 RepID=A0A5S9QP13_9GAMM|nr:ribonuclease D [Zhongshania aliphaticivorans]CAA0088191.1 Ribonuclease D [Zhongshania aliphaticivorans]CAA0116119.1 Ribonuclease D [Zhongshania aliphaticivorans]CAA0120373.1 Ribonuclease D [Zhongshania aliphaticivorans]